ncbi:MAG: glutathione S-transferase family protein, partial [Alphaproteobacteria bacterium]|nr:glutathione S-transferase family protein [Alphaproteobacteria bacterium]
KAVAWAFEKMAEETLYWALVDCRWRNNADFDKGPRQFFDKVPAALRPVVVVVIKRQVRRSLHGQGTSRHSQQEVAKLADRALAATAEQLGAQPFLMGAQPCGADAVVFAVIAGILCSHFDSPLRQAAERYGNLRDYVARMQARYCPALETSALGQAAA